MNQIMAGQALEATTSDPGPLQNEGQAAAHVLPPNTRPKWVAAGWAGALVVAALAIGMALRMPVDVPDSSSPLRSNHRGMVNAENSVGQTFVAKRDNLDKMSLLLTVEEPNEFASFTLTIRDGSPNGPILRTVARKISSLTTEDSFRRDIFNLFYVDQRWQLFEFEPIPNSAGRPLYFAVEGKDVPTPSKVGVAMMFRSGYPEGTAYVNGDKQNAHVIFRAESRNEVRDFLGVLSNNVTLDRQGPAANPATYAALGMAYALLLLGLLGATWRALRR